MQFNVTNGDRRGAGSTWDLVSDSYLYGPRTTSYDHMTAHHPSIYDDFDAVMAVNVRGAFLVSKYVLPLMRPHGGAILHLSSGVATTGTRNRAAYTASKGAILSLTRNMALDYAADKVRVNCLCPGFVNTPLLASMPAERRAKLAALHPLGRMGEPEDLVPMALLLISDQSQWITGQAIAVDGGFNAGHADDI